MTDWTAGYVTDVGYTYDYWPELNPLRMRFALATAGFSAPKVETACELGFGQGLSVAIHAATLDTLWFGNDFNPVQVQYAQDLVRGAGAEAKLYEESFAEFTSRSDLPEFDFIALHGVWTWVSDENRALIVDFIRRKLKSGGVAYVSYNTQPGWATTLPIRHLLTQHAAIMGTVAQGTMGRIESAIAFVDKVLGTAPIFAKYNPAVRDYFNAMKGQDRHYLAHEYFNRDFQPMYFSEVAERLSAAKLGFACAAHFLDHVDAANVTPEQQAILQDIFDPNFREGVRDYCVNQRFRRDYWLKGARKVTAVEQADALGAQRVVLVQPREEVRFTLSWAAGEVSLRQDLFRPVLDVLSDHRPRTLQQIVQAIGRENTTLAQVGMAAVIFLGTGALQLAQHDEVCAKAKQRTDQLNLVLMDQACTGLNPKPVLASPLVGGIEISRPHALFLLARAKGKQQPADWAKFAHEALLAERKTQAQGEKPGTSDNLSNLGAEVRAFARDYLPIFQALKIA